MRNTILLLIAVASIINLNAIAQNKTNQTNVLASKPKVEDKTDQFNKHMNVALMSYKEVKDLVKFAIDNYNDKQLWHLAYELMTSKYYEFEPIIIKARIEHAKTPSDKAGMRCNYLQSAFLVKWRKRKYNKNGDMQISQKLKNEIYDAIDNFPSDCREQNNLNHFSGAVCCSMAIASRQENDIDRAWDIYKTAKAKIPPPPYINDTDTVITPMSNLDGGIRNLAVYLRKNINRKNKKVSQKTVQEIIKAIEKMPDNAMGGKPAHLEHLNFFKKYEKEVAGTSLNNK